MWLLLLTVGAAALVVLVTRGNWHRLVHLPVQGSLLFVTGVFIQIALEIVQDPVALVMTDCRPLAGSALASIRQ